MTQAACYHCGLGVVDPNRWTMVIQQQTQCFCCPGCQSVASAIIAGGFDQYYQRRSNLAPTAKQTQLEQRQADQAFELCDDQQLQESFVLELGEDERETRLGIHDIHCAACCWLIENALRQLPGVTFIAVNLGYHRATLRWLSSTISLSRILKQLHQLGYHASPVNHARPTPAQSQRLPWLRLGVAAMVMMQSGMFSFALYSGEWTGMANEHKRLLQILGLVMTTPVMLFSATPFFGGAWRSLRARQVGMDIPVSVALCVAFVASFFTAMTGIGDVYFDSISMFVFLLLLARFVESSARAQFFDADVMSLLPRTCRVLSTAASADSEVVNSVEATSPTQCWTDKKITDVALNEHVQVGVGEVIPFDGTVIKGQSCVNESAFSGESLPVTKKIGDLVFAGTINGEGVLIIEVHQRLGQARLDVITHLAERHQAQQPAIAQLTNRVAQNFSLAVLALAVISGGYWWAISGWQQAIAIVISVLVVSCPCALSLATPSALAFCYQALRQHGLWIINADLIARIKNIKVVVFDKTGTLTTGTFGLIGVRLTPQAIALNYQHQQVKEIAAALESVSAHPMASAFASIATDWQAGDVVVASGLGVEAQINGQRYRIGSRQFCQAWCVIDDVTVMDDLHAMDDVIVLGDMSVKNEVSVMGDEGIAGVVESTRQLIYLATPNELLAIFAVQDTLRDDAVSLVSAIQKQGLEVIMLSGDRSGAAEQIARQVGIAHYHTGLSPEQKLQYLTQLQTLHTQAQHTQTRRHGVMMVGDGINDIPVLTQADVSIAMNAATDLAKVQSDAILLRNQLSPLLALFQHARKTRRIVYQNLWWALLYNGLSLPAAAMGWVSPWVAAIGMSVSSLIVTMNSVRLRKIR